MTDFFMLIIFSKIAKYKNANVANFVNYGKTRMSVEVTTHNGLVKRLSQNKNNINFCPANDHNRSTKSIYQGTFYCSD